MSALVMLTNDMENRLARALHASSQWCEVNNPVTCNHECSNIAHEVFRALAGEVGGCSNCLGKGGFKGDDGCGCGEHPPEHWAECAVCLGTGWADGRVPATTDDRDQTP